MANLDPRITLVRARNRLGLIRARALGAEYATSDVLIFLDSHCEVCDDGRRVKMKMKSTDILTEIRSVRL